MENTFLEVWSAGLKMFMAWMGADTSSGRGFKSFTSGSRAGFMRFVCTIRSDSLRVRL